MLISKPHHPGSIYLAQHNTKFGKISLLMANHQLLRCSFGWLDLPYPKASTQQSLWLAEQIGEPIKPDQPNLTLAPQGTEFQIRVWQSLLNLPYGETRSYQALADSIGQPKAARAVANAVAANPIAWFIPCHRVIRSNGEVGGFAWGIALKKQLLDAEKLALQPN
ncbi:methylated-DNA--[protein]-cysteine S-methyltransferase [Thiomicrospira sp. R3]|uniref:methylated-DNA--[protein]-cysteine S-methyltransferase n=1 Tax=Thiomicrospira sp. R3 TaxID=3035472 RepID=UPI00259B014D|nr:methylated-DNA--[protein]-cysteine S-methyltransferase [Thiomicrospira sp. R3]WFE68209.1 methylated-DNA--[protein]-cysteine S-methyltransferase [Thiomicrospira sp. R3]